MDLRDRDEAKTRIKGLLRNKVHNLYPSFYINIKVKQSRYRPGVAQRVPGS